MRELVAKWSRMRRGKPVLGILEDTSELKVTCSRQSLEWELDVLYLILTIQQAHEYTTYLGVNRELCQWGDVPNSVS